MSVNCGPESLRRRREIEAAIGTMGAEKERLHKGIADIFRTEGSSDWER